MTHINPRSVRTGLNKKKSHQSPVTVNRIIASIDSVESIQKIDRVKNRPQHRYRTDHEKKLQLAQVSTLRRYEKSITNHCTTSYRRMQPKSAGNFDIDILEISIFELQWQFFQPVFYLWIMAEFG